MPDLTEEGRAQAAALGALIASEGVRVELVLVSPLQRALATAECVLSAAFPQPSSPLPVASPTESATGTGSAGRIDQGKSPLSTAASQRHPPVIVLEALRERNSACFADWRRPISVAAASYPSFSFAEIHRCVYLCQVFIASSLRA
jgi:bisphosphoglycerate-dependent phosphoglycerate mutase